jgi:hypothetical protein
MITPILVSGSLPEKISLFDNLPGKLVWERREPATDLHY